MVENTNTERTMSMLSIDLETQRLEKKISEQNTRLSQISIRKWPSQNSANQSNQLILDSSPDSVEVELPKSAKKRKKKTSKFKRWLRNTFCAQTSVQTTDLGSSHRSSTNSARQTRELTADSWKEALDHQLQS